MNQFPINVQNAYRHYERSVIDYRREAKKTALMITLLAIAVIHITFNVMGMMSKVSTTQLGIINIGAVGFSAVVLSGLGYIELGRQIHWSDVVGSICTFVILSLGYFIANGYGIAGKLDVKTIGALNIGTYLVWIPLMTFVTSALQVQSLYRLNQSVKNNFNDFELSRVNYELSGPQAGRLNAMSQQLLAIEALRVYNGNPAPLLPNFRQDLRRFRADFGSHGVARLLEKYNHEKPGNYRQMTEALLFSRAFLF